MTAFSTLNVLPAAQLNNLNELGYLEMTPVQAASLPVILAGNDVRVQARTGSGKTAAFGLGLLHRIDVSLFQTQALVLCPTRELADQVAGELRRLARFLPNTKILTLCGGQPFGAQRDSLQHAPHIIVATPGRLLDMGFSDAIDEVIRFAPATRQTLLFSATWPETIAAISGRVQQQPIRIEIDTVDALPAIEQQFFETSAQGKISLLQTLLSQHQPASCVVFCNTKKDCQAVCDALNAAGQSALALHGDLEQRDRDQTLVRFANGSARILVATDVAARGLDIKSLELVVNYELAWDPEVHVHRIGRTARAGSSGLAISFCAPEEAQRANILSEMLQLKLNWLNAPARQPLFPLAAEMATLCIDGGKKAKMRPGDILGALTGDIGLDGADIGKINVHPMHVYVAVRQAVAQKARTQLQNGKIKGKSCRVRLLK
ncbi:ATP-dependent RNA helicase [Salmonella enterica]|nr:ATP-dependent RNA helicase [Salmonella enterica]EIM9326813.1 ATP-dependent RNA helicase [Salmonella enterica]